MATGTVALSTDQINMLADAMQARLDVILTTDRRAGVISRNIVRRAIRLSNLYPQVRPFFEKNTGLPVFDKIIEETGELAEDVNDWIDTLRILGEEYGSLKTTIKGFRERLP